LFTKTDFNFYTSNIELAPPLFQQLNLLATDKISFTSCLVGGRFYLLAFHFTVGGISWLMPTHDPTATARLRDGIHQEVKQ
jgi:hypothetical protein